MGNEKSSGSPKISIIVPVFNVSKYLPVSLDSILRQSFEDWECIIIDDGSTDGSGEICDSYARIDSRIRVIHKKNEGVASARNTGLTESKGEFISFIDPDDWADPTYLETLYNLINKNEADVSQIGYYKEFTTFQTKKSLVYEQMLLEGSDISEELLKDKALPSFLWNKLFRKEIVGEKFPAGRVYEDFMGVTLWSKNIKKIVMSPETLYHYRMRKGSITAENNYRNQSDFMKACIQRADVVSEAIPDKFGKKEKEKYLYENIIKRAKSISRNEKNKNDRKDTLLWLSDSLKKISDPGIRSLGMKKWLRGYMMRKNPGFFSFMMRAVNVMDFHGRYRLKHYFE